MKHVLILILFLPLPYLAFGQDTTSFYYNSDKHLKGCFDRIDSTPERNYRGDTINFELYKLKVGRLFGGIYKDKNIYVRFNKRYTDLKTRSSLFIKVRKTNETFNGMCVYEFAGTF